ncbi:MAG: sensor domain-containing protein [Micromonosporaceae bacterium]|nr:sensor domain-containing protein [Micromonosporaceae bacterium]
MPLFVLRIFGLILVPLGMGLLVFVPSTLAVRALANLHRRLAGQWLGVPVPQPYLPPPHRGVIGLVKRMVTDPATWRDQLWLLLNVPVGFFLGVLPLGLLANGVRGVLTPFAWSPNGAGPRPGALGGVDYVGIPLTSRENAVAAFPIGLAFLVALVWLTPWIQRLHGRFHHALLGPTRRSELASRVRRLTETRADAVDSSAAELRRIERDLHDGAQARLVAMGMNLGAAERLLDEDPAAARALLVEAREASVAALQELRNLVRGIHPPVLSDRGLGDAVRALALASPLRVEVEVELPGRLDPPVESAAYFAVAELLTNATKHAGARQAWVDLKHEDGVLRMTVADDGHGGADPSLGTGLRGIERRLGTFDGTIFVSSPVGGPTVVTMEVPCTVRR